VRLALQTHIQEEGAGISSLWNSFTLSTLASTPHDAYALSVALAKCDLQTRPTNMASFLLPERAAMLPPSPGFRPRTAGNPPTLCSLDSSTPMSNSAN